MRRFASDSSVEREKELQTAKRFGGDDWGRTKIQTKSCAEWLVVRLQAKCE